MGQELFRGAREFRAWVSEEVGRVDRLGALKEYLLALGAVLVLAAAPGVAMWVCGEVLVP